MTNYSPGTRLSLWTSDDKFVAYQQSQPWRYSHDQLQSRHKTVPMDQ
jgi:hypothetical protein